MEHEPLVERIIHRLVRKHIAGTTMDSALDAAKSLVLRDVSPSITFISSNVLEKSKAKYITTTYSELVRRIARSGIKASVQVPLEQLGADIDEEAAMENLKAVAEVGNKYGVFIWAQTEGLGKGSLKAISKMDGVGPAIDESDADQYADSEMFRSAKVVFRNYESKAKGDITKRLDFLKRSFPNLVISSVPDRYMAEVLKGKGRSDVTIEFEFGDSDKKINVAIKKGVKACVLVPFGKDWIKYAMNSAPEGYMRFVAGKLLKDGEDGAETE